ncbi:hypothetical protein C0J52_28012, partial [Blattella germanica]
NEKRNSEIIRRGTHKLTEAAKGVDGFSYKRINRRYNQPEKLNEKRNSEIIRRGTHKLTEAAKGVDGFSYKRINRRYNQPEKLYRIRSSFANGPAPTRVHPRSREMEIKLHCYYAFVRLEYGNGELYVTLNSSNGTLRVVALNLPSSSHVIPK